MLGLSKCGPTRGFEVDAGSEILGQRPFLFGHGGSGIVRRLHRLQLRVFQVTESVSQRHEFVLQTYRVLRGGGATEQTLVTTSASLDDRDIGLDTGQFRRCSVGLGLAARQLRRTRGGAGRDLCQRGILWRVPPRRLDPSNPLVQRRDLQQAALVPGVGDHATNLRQA